MRSTRVEGGRDVITEDGDGKLVLLARSPALRNSFAFGPSFLPSFIPSFQRMLCFDVVS